ncbi:GTP cyclohydrolase I FolE [bacterium]|nr:GTP cyclohydrolase I FolE [bacterium]MBU0899953.1 GTP cyclohydrolase I FolE [bacterium]MBU1153589.1 GTP cyclohydrolase I FolE [bacterium]MBU1781823.1 GTP cyclohydrolase I FolE [bacterium]
MDKFVDKEVDKEKIKKAITMIIEAIGDDPNRKGLVKTPERVADAYEEIFSGINKNLAKELEIYLPDTHEEMILVKDIPFYSVCEHHFLPFHGKAHVAYLPKEGRITGLSKLVRVVEISAKRLQLQERFTTEIADLLMKVLVPHGVLVMVEAEHLCMTMRGVRKPGSITVTSAVRGAFKNEATRAEALAIIKNK